MRKASPSRRLNQSKTLINSNHRSEQDSKSLLRSNATHTKKEHKMSNVYSEAMFARFQTALAKNCSASNEKKMRKLCTMLDNERLATLLETSNVDASRFDRAIYANEKVIKFASQAVALNAKDLNENTYAIFRTAINCARHNVALTKTMIEASISRDVKVDDADKHLVFQRSIIQTAETIAAQSQTSTDALVTLNVIEARADMKNAYSVNLSALTLALCDAFKIDATVIEVEDANEESDDVVDAA